jgi:hypothetical protein
MTELQPSRSVKRPTQSLSKQARSGSALPPNPPGMGLPEKSGAGTRTPSNSDSPGNLSHFYVVWLIFGGNCRRRSKVWGKTSFREKLACGQESPPECLDDARRVGERESLALFSLPGKATNAPSLAMMAVASGASGLEHLTQGTTTVRGWRRGLAEFRQNLAEILYGTDRP